MTKKIINTIEISSDIADIFMKELATITGKVYTAEEDNVTVFTDEGQEIYNNLYDRLRDFTDEVFETSQENNIYETQIELP